MTKEVKLRICGMHMHGEDGDRDDVEVISVGQMCERDGFAWITYEEVVEEEENGLVSVVKNLVKYKDGQKATWCLCQMRRRIHIIRRRLGNWRLRLARNRSRRY